MPNTTQPITEIELRENTNTQNENPQLDPENPQKLDDSKPKIDEKKVSPPKVNTRFDPTYIEKQLYAFDLILGGT